jgi:hypothetical protein
MLLCIIVDTLARLDRERQPGALLSCAFCLATDFRINLTCRYAGSHLSPGKQQPFLIRYLRESDDDAGKKRFQGANAWTALGSIEDKRLRDSTVLDNVFSLRVWIVLFDDQPVSLF